MLRTGAACRPRPRRSPGGCHAQPKAGGLKLEQRAIWSGPRRNGRGGWRLETALIQRFRANACSGRRTNDIGARYARLISAPTRVRPSAVRKGSPRPAICRCAVVWSSLTSLALSAFQKDSALSQGYGLGGKSGVRDAKPRSANLLRGPRFPISTQVPFSIRGKQK